eukprot:TRINITY_DN181_c1_g2_i1.p1 TRINITY_DN181_c1_g2~~TRINITY_DN181_c1_g2_i1.p1  ORF type:complete len:509 (+),score=115.55 TRINITY_DN181_c1_g2_i1:34-1527(+)
MGTSYFLVLALLSGGAGATLPQLLSVKATDPEFSCTGYGGLNVQCDSDIYRSGSSIFYSLQLGSCKDSCAGVEGTCHEGEMTMTQLFGSCAYGSSSSIPWNNVSQTTMCQGDTDFFVRVPAMGCASHVVVTSSENNVTLEFNDYSSTNLPADVLFDLSCPGVENARLRDVVNCGAYSGHDADGYAALSFFNTSGNERRVVFLPGTGTASNGVWSPPSNLFILNFTFTVPDEYTDYLDFTYQIEHMVRNAWSPLAPVNIMLSNKPPLPPVLPPSSGSIFTCTATSIEDWECVVYVRDSMGPVLHGNTPWTAFDVQYTTNGCLETDILISNYTLVNITTFSFMIKRVVTCYYWDLQLTLNISTDDGTIGHRDGDAIVHTGMVLRAPIIRTPTPTDPPTPTPTFPKKSLADHSTLYIVFGGLFAGLVLFGSIYVAYKRYATESKVGTFVVLGEGKDKSVGGPVIPVIDEEGPTTQMKDINDCESCTTDYKQAEDNFALAE